MKSALITGVGGSAGSAVASFFRERGFRIIGTDTVQTQAAVDEFHLVPRGDDPAFIRALIDLIRRSSPTLVIASAWEELPAIARFRRAINGCGAQVFIPEVAVTDMANDKLLTANKLRSLGVAAPWTLPGETTPLEAGKVLGYPLLAKPRMGHGGREVIVFQDPEEAERERRRDIVYQEFMSGEESEVNLFAYPAGYVRSVAVLLKTLMKNGIAGNPVHVRRVIRRDVAELAIVATRKLHLEGPIDMDIRRDRDGLPRILEINARAGANILSTSEVLESMHAAVIERMTCDTDFPHASDATFPASDTNRIGEDPTLSGGQRN